MTCKNCGKELGGFDIGATKKLVNRCATEYLCIPCLAEHFKVTEDYIWEKIRFFQKNGCVLFPPLEKQD